MKLELEPRDGERIITPEERERMKRRLRPIPEAAIAAFGEADEQLIKVFLSQLIFLTEQIHHAMEANIGDLRAREAMQRLHVDRLALFQSPRPAVKRFIDLLELCASEAWSEWETLIRGLRSEFMRHFYETKNRTGVDAAKESSYLMQVDDRSDDKAVELRHQGRISAQELDELIFHFPLKELVRQIIEARQVLAGEIWDPT